VDLILNKYDIHNNYYTTTMESILYKGHKYFCNLIKIGYLTSSALLLCRVSLRGRDRIVPLVVGFVLFRFTVHREINYLIKKKIVVGFISTCAIRTYHTNVMSSNPAHGEV
jgi:hypothetical protein